MEQHQHVDTDPKVVEITRINILENGSPWYKDSSSRKIVIMSFFIFSFTIVELVLGILTHSLALLADAFHMISDQISLLIGFAAIQMGKRSKSLEYSYGWQRAEIIGALINGVFLLSVCLFIFLEAISRFLEVTEVQDPFLIVVVGGAGLLINILGLLIFRGHAHAGHSHGHSHGHDHGRRDSDEISPSSSEVSDGHGHGHGHKHGKLNMHGVFLHMLGDALGSIGAMISGLGIWLPWGKPKYYLDPICSVVIAFIILSTCVPLIRRCTKILMQSVPDNIDMDVIERDLLKLEGVLDVHDLHVWQLADTKIIGTVHLTCPADVNFLVLATKMKKVMHTHGIHSTTFQPEFVDTIADTSSAKECHLLCDGPDNCQESLCCSPLLEEDKQQQVLKKSRSKSSTVELP